MQRRKEAAVVAAKTKGIFSLCSEVNGVMEVVVAAAEKLTKKLLLKKSDSVKNV